MWKQRGSPRHDILKKNLTKKVDKNRMDTIHTIHDVIHAYVLSLPQDHARYDDLVAHSHQHVFDAPFLLTPTKIEGIYGKDLHHEARVQACRSTWYRTWITPSMLGCGLSHLKALRTFLCSPESTRYALILEDDARIQPGLDAALWLTLIQQMTQQDLDLVHLGGHETEWGYRTLVCGGGGGFLSYPSYPSPERARIVPVWWWSTTASYLVTRRGAQRILARLGDGNLVYHIDTVYHGLIHSGILRAGCVSIPWFMTRPYESHNSIGSRWIDPMMNPDLVHLLLTMSMIQIPFLEIPLTAVLLLQGLLLAVLPLPWLVVMSTLLMVDVAKMHIKNIKNKNKLDNIFILFQCLTILILRKRARVVWLAFWITLFLIFAHIFYSVSRGI